MKEKEQRRVNERALFKHHPVNTAHEFMQKFFSLPIFSSVMDDGLAELEYISSVYKQYLEMIKVKIEDHNLLKNKVEENLT